MRVSLLALAAVLLPIPAFGQPKTGKTDFAHDVLPVLKARCAKCHTEIAEHHLQTRHSRTFHYGEKLTRLPRPSAPLPDPDDPSVKQSLVVDGSRLDAVTHIKDKVFRTVVYYAFGTEGRYLSYVGKDDAGQFRAFHLSYYHDGNQAGWGA